MSETQYTPPRRARNLTDEDVAALVEKMNESHACRFKDISPADMSFLKDLLIVYKETRSEVIKWLIRGVVYGSLALVSIIGYFKLKGH